MKHRVIEGRIYRELQLEAADTAEARRHVSAERPTPHSVARRHRVELEGRR